MDEIIGIISRSYKGYASRLWETITHPFGDYNFFTLLILVSLAVWGLEIIFPWRKKQPKIRKDFWIDAFYMFFNFYIFNLIIFVALSNTTAHLFGNMMELVGLPRNHLFDFSHWNIWVQFVAFFLIADFVQWSVHNLLHRIPVLWRLHRVHHSVKEMGFAAHLRYHFMENVFYKTALYIFLGYLFNFKLEYAFFTRRNHHYWSLKPCKRRVGLWTTEVYIEQPENAHLAPCERTTILTSKRNELWYFTQHLGLSVQNQLRALKRS